MEYDIVFGPSYKSHPNLGLYSILNLNFTCNVFYLQFSRLKSNHYLNVFRQFKFKGVMHSWVRMSFTHTEPLLLQLYTVILILASQDSLKDRLFFIFNAFYLISGSACLLKYLLNSYLKLPLSSLDFI